MPGAAARVGSLRADEDVFGCRTAIQVAAALLLRARWAHLAVVIKVRLAIWSCVGLVGMLSLAILQAGIAMATFVREFDASHGGTSTPLRIVEVVDEELHALPACVLACALVENFVCARPRSVAVRQHEGGCGAFLALAADVVLRHLHRLADLGTRRDVPESVRLRMAVASCALIRLSGQFVEADHGGVSVADCRQHGEGQEGPAIQGALEVLAACAGERIVHFVHPLEVVALF
mmetsp:Transcript_13369/g.36959  ORF Transcript_13369/g.36959 Transcript_13369/m.36959 type:complete len:234 (-) Transcript_13369:238-939(-)